MSATRVSGPSALMTMVECGLMRHAGRRQRGSGFCRLVSKVTLCKLLHNPKVEVTVVSRGTPPYVLRLPHSPPVFNDLRAPPGRRHGGCFVPNRRSGAVLLLLNGSQVRTSSSTQRPPVAGTHSCPRERYS